MFEKPNDVYAVLTHKGDGICHQAKFDGQLHKNLLIGRFG